MAARITLGTLLRHMQAMKIDLQKQIRGLHELFVGLDTKVHRLEGEMHRGFADAKAHREALQEDLYETMRVQAKHSKKLARL